MVDSEVRLLFIRSIERCPPRRNCGTSAGVIFATGGVENFLVV